jgi:hypothetical protein
MHKSAREFQTFHEQPCNIAHRLLALRKDVIIDTIIDIHIVHRIICEWPTMADDPLCRRSSLPAVINQMYCTVSTFTFALHRHLSLLALQQLFSTLGPGHPSLTEWRIGSASRYASLTRIEQR